MPKKIKKKSWKPEPKDWKGCQKRFVEAKRLLRDIFVSTPTDFYLRRLYTKRACLALLVQSIAQKLKGNGNVRQFQTSVDISVPPFVCSMWFSWAHIYIRTLYCSINVSTCRTLRFVRCIFRLLVLFVKQTKSRTKTNFGATTTATPMMANSGRMPAVMWRKYTRKTSSVRPVMFSLFSLCSSVLEKISHKQNA